MSINIVQGSILDFKGDAIVNPANSFLRHGGGLAAVIANAAAPMVQDTSGSLAEYVHGPLVPETVEDAEWREEQTTHALIPTGAAGITSAGRLPYRAIIHAVGPIWGAGLYCEHQLLRATHSSAYVAAVARDYQSIAFPAISCGVFGYPVELAAPTAIAAIRDAQALYSPVIDVTFYLFEDEHFEAYQEALNGN